MISALFLLIAAAGCLYLLCAVAAARLPKTAPALARHSSAVTILKPLHGAEPRLFENLSSFCAQDHPSPVQIVFGVRDPRDAAIAVVERLRESFPAADLQLVVDPTAHGANLKVANLINMARFWPTATSAWGRTTLPEWRPRSSPRRSAR
jgi:ceramide glucosyltransferase